jgi:hypothetical protein
MLNVFGAMQIKRENDCWIWRQSDLSFADQCQEWILYQGDFYDDGEPKFIKRGVQLSNLYGREPVLLFRLYGQVETSYLAEQIEYAIDQWQKYSVYVNKVQLDFDSPSSALLKYAAMVHKLKQRLPRVMLSVTGLVTWYEDNPAGVAALAKEVEYIAFQLYQDHEPLVGVRQRAKKLADFPYAYKLGITTHESFSGLQLASGENHKGTILFLNVRNKSDK